MACVYATIYSARQTDRFVIQAGEDEVLVKGPFPGFDWDRDWKKPTLCSVTVTTLPLHGITQVNLVKFPMWVNNVMHKGADTGHIIYANLENKAQLEDWNWLEIPNFAIVKAQPTPLPKKGAKLTCFLEVYTNRNTGQRFLDSTCVDWGSSTGGGDGRATPNPAGPARHPSAEAIGGGGRATPPPPGPVHPPSAVGGGANALVPTGNAWSNGAPRPSQDAGTVVLRRPSADSLALHNQGRQSPPRTLARLNSGSSEYGWRKLDEEDRVSLTREWDNNVLRRLISQCETDIWSGVQNDPYRCLGLLRNYLHHTMLRVGETGQVFAYVLQSDKSYDYQSARAIMWNTGLSEKLFTNFEIFAIGKRTGNPAQVEFSIVSFVPQGDLDRNGPFFTDSRGPVPRPRTDTLPERANYLHGDGIRLEQLHFDPRAAQRVTSTLNIKHILGIKEGTEQERLDEREARISRLHPPEKYMRLSDLELYSRIKAALEVSIKKATSNPRMAVPQFFRSWGEDGNLQLLLPLRLDPLSNVVTCAVPLTLRETTSATGGASTWDYKAGTLLSVDMALNNARLIQSIDQHWLSEGLGTQEPQQSQEPQQPQEQLGLWRTRVGG